MHIYHMAGNFRGMLIRYFGGSLDNHKKLHSQKLRSSYTRTVPLV